MQMIPMIYKTVRATARVMRVTSLVRTAAAAGAAAFCCAAVWRVWRA